jgi:hypothetical protein
MVDTITIGHIFLGYDVKFGYMCVLYNYQTKVISLSII